MSYIEIHDRAGMRRVRASQYYTCGRAANNDIVLYGALVSRNHARLAVQTNQVIIEDVGSTHGTYINGKPLQGWKILRNGDQVQMGDVWAIYRTNEEGILPGTPTPPQGLAAGPAQLQPFSSAATLPAPALLDPKMMRCPHCGTMNLKSNSLCFRCGGNLWQPCQQREGERRADPAVAPARPAVKGIADRPRWLVLLIVCMLVMGLCLLGLLVGILLAGTSLGQWWPPAAFPS
jgi:hypothetical protein